MTKHTFADDQLPHDMTLVVYHSHEHKIQAERKVIAMAFSRRQPMPQPCSTLQSLSRETRLYAFSRATKHAKTVFAHSKNFSETCLRVKL